MGCQQMHVDKGFPLGGGFGLADVPPIQFSEHTTPSGALVVDFVASHHWQFSVGMGIGPVASTIPTEAFKNNGRSSDNLWFKGSVIFF